MLRSLLVDFNSYFASCEQQARPELRGKPVGVVPMLADTTCLIAASYEAKAFGVKTLTKVAEAKARIPGIELVIARHELYIRMHHQAVAIVDRIVPVREVLSIDEMDCELTGKMCEPATATRLALQVKAALAQELGECMLVSIGIGPNTFIAKSASNMQKPNGLVIITKAECPARLFTRSLRDLTGIGKRMEQRLNEAGITTVAQLASQNRQQMRSLWGSVGGEEFYDKLRGETLYVRDGGSHTIGHSHVLAPEQRNDTDGYAVINRLTQKAAMRLRKNQWLARRMTLTIRYLNAPSWHHELRFDATDDTLHLLRALERGFAARPAKRGLKWLQVGMTLHDLIDEHQASGYLFAADQPKKALFKTLDELNSKYGKQAAYFGGAHQALGSAKVAIAFNHIPDPTTEG